MATTEMRTVSALLFGRKWVWVVVGIVWLAASISSAVLYFVAAKPSGHPDLLQGLVLNGLVWAYWVLLGPLIAWITRRHDAHRCCRYPCSATRPHTERVPPGCT